MKREDRTAQLRSSVVMTPKQKSAVATKRKPVAPIMDILDMDGRNVAPYPRIFKYNDPPPKVAMVRSVIVNFLAKGESGRHSAHGHLLRYVMAYCEANDIGYVLQRVTIGGKPAGYHIKRLEDIKPLGLERQLAYANEQARDV